MSSIFKVIFPTEFSAGNFIMPNDTLQQKNVPKSATNPGQNLCGVQNILDWAAEPG